jgi:Phage integrase, N-terminal SAM-like domain
MSHTAGYSAATTPTSPRLLDVVRDTARREGHNERTIIAFVNWVTLFVRYHGRRNPRDLQLADVLQFLEQVGKTARDPLIAIEEARLALEFLYRDVLCHDLGELPRPKPPRLLDQVRQVLRVRHYALATEACYVDWIKRFILFHGKRHPRDLKSSSF